MNEWVIVGIVAIVVLFGASKLPQIARNMGKAQGEFKKGLKEGAVDESPTTPPPAAAPTPPPTGAPTPPPAQSPTEGQQPTA